jgi:hypothetical protein
VWDGNGKAEATNGREFEATNMTTRAGAARRVGMILIVGNTPLSPAISRSRLEEASIPVGFVLMTSRLM